MAAGSPTVLACPALLPSAPEAASRLPASGPDPTLLPLATVSSAAPAAIGAQGVTSELTPC